MNIQRNFHLQRFTRTQILTHSRDEELFHTPKANAAALKAAKKAAKRAATKAAVPNNGTVAISSVVKPTSRYSSISL